MAAPKGMKYWQLAEKMGRNPKYTPKALWQKAIEYFEWVEDNPLQEQKLSSGEIFAMDKMRAMTIRGFCLFAGIDQQTFANYEVSDNFFGITTRIRDIIYQQKFEGAAADLLNPNIIARELGLAEKSDVNLRSIPDDIQKNVDDMTTGDITTLIGNGTDAR